MSYAFFRHPTQGPGFGPAPDPFASISENRQQRQENDDGIDFDDTYDGLGDQLDEADDDFNDDTFGGGQASTKPVGRDFDFFGSTNKVSTAINEEAVRYNRQQPASKPTIPPKAALKPFRTGYETYKNQSHPDLQVDVSLWGTGPSKSTSDHTAQYTQVGQRPNSSVTASKKMMSLEEVEAAMNSQAQKASPNPVPQQQDQALPPFSMAQMQQYMPATTHPPPQQHSISHFTPASQHGKQRHKSLQHEGLQVHGSAPIKIQQRPIQESSQHLHGPLQSSQVELPTQPIPAPTPGAKSRQESSFQALDARTSSQPRQILQNPNRHSANMTSRPAEPLAPRPVHQTGPSSAQSSHPGGFPIIYHPSQIMDLPEEERQKYVELEAMRAKRNHKIYQLSKGNGLMTPQDKNFITRIQLQQLMTATGNVNEQDPDTALSEDFYYQVYNQIENRPRHNPQQPLSNFAQTYLFRTGGRQGAVGRRNRGGESHMQRMEQQVQRAVEAAKAKPKNKQLVIEGSLGKISFSNAKTPKPLLNIKRHNSDAPGRAGSKHPVALSTTDRKAILKNIEAVYSTLMRMEDHDRRHPGAPLSDDDQAGIQRMLTWQTAFDELKENLWTDLKVTEPVMPDSAILHPFIAFLSYPKGKKAIPRVFAHIDETKRLTILTIVILHLEVLDVVRLASPQSTGPQSPSLAREQIDLFMQSVMPNLFSTVSEAPLTMVIGMLGLISERVNLNAVVRTRVGLELMTMILSRAAILKATEAVNDETWNQWLAVYNRFFDMTEPLLADMFPAVVNAMQDQYVWQFLAATGSGASPDQQQRLVIAVKDRVMDALQQSKTLSPEMALQRRGNINLFMQAIGLDVDLLDS